MKLYFLNYLIQDISSFVSFYSFLILCIWIHFNFYRLIPSSFFLLDAGASLQASYAPANQLNNARIHWERRGSTLSLSNFEFELIVLKVVRPKSQRRAFEQAVVSVTLMDDM
jgi:hypothetical protein